jgi:hypothetical protein
VRFVVLKACDLAFDQYYIAAEPDALKCVSADVLALIAGNNDASKK